MDEKEDMLKAQDEKFKLQTSEIEKRLQFVKEKEDDMVFSEKQYQSNCSALEQKEGKCEEQVLV